MSDFKGRTQQVRDLDIPYIGKEEAFIFKSILGTVLYIPVLDIQCMDEEEWVELMNLAKSAVEKIKQEGILEEEIVPEIQTKNILVEAHDHLHDMIKLVKENARIFMEEVKIKSLLTGEIIKDFDQLMKEMEAVENEIKKEIKMGAEGLEETEYFMIRKTTTYEYDPEKLREVYPDGIFFIEAKESVKKAQLDKAIKDGMAPEIAKEALREKSMSISFIDKQKIADREVKEIAV